MNSTPTRINRSSEFQSNRCGATVVLMLLLLTLVFIFVAFAIDLGRVQLVQLKLQGAADFASRAGAEAMARGVGDAGNQASYEAAVRDEVAMVVSKSNAFGHAIGFDPANQITFGNAAENGGKFVFTPTSNGSMDSITNSMTVSPDLNQFPLLFGAFLGRDSLALYSGATSKVTDRDIVLVIDKSASMLIHDAGMIPTSAYHSNLRVLEEALYGPGDGYHPDNTDYPNEPRNTEFIYSGSNIQLSRIQALKFALIKFRDQIDATRGKERLGLVAYSEFGNRPANAPTAPEPIDIHAGLSSYVFDLMVGDGATPYNPDGSEPTSSCCAAALEDESTGYDNFDFNFLRMRRFENTNIASGITEGTAVLFGSGRRSYATPIMIVMTDGVHNMSGTPEGAASAAMSSHPDMMIYTITFGDSADQPKMQSVASIGKGRHFHATDVNQLVAVFEDLATNAGVVLIK